MDAFLVAFLLSKVLTTVLGGAINSGLAPTYIRARLSRGEVAAKGLAAGAMALYASLLLAVTVALALTGPRIVQLLGGQFAPAKLALATRLFYVLLPTIFFANLTMFYGPILNASDRFAVVAVTPVFTPLCASLGLLVGYHRWGIFALAYGTVVGSVVEFAFLTCVSTRIGSDLIALVAETRTWAEGCLSRIWLHVARHFASVWDHAHRSKYGSEAQRG
jgi:putative peptidoglycan lipid II flippase